jgi:RNase P/RNase MRP subunit POP5
MGLFLIRFNGSQGVIRCKHTEKENTIEILNNIDRIKDKKVAIDTIATSGTIRSLINKHMSNFDI